jgi:hypothetical protein
MEIDDQLKQIENQLERLTNKLITKFEASQEEFNASNADNTRKMTALAVTEAASVAAKIAKETAGNYQVLCNDLTYIRKDVAEIKEKLEGSYITKMEFETKFDPVKKIVYGMVAVVLLGVAGALVALVVNLK